MQYKWFPNIHALCVRLELKTKPRKISGTRGMAKNDSIKFCITPLDGAILLLLDALNVLIGMHTLRFDSDYVEIVVKYA